MAPNTEFPSQLDNLTAGNGTLPDSMDSTGYSPAVTANRQNDEQSRAQTSSAGFWQKLTLKTKVLGLALSLGVAPVLGVGGLGYLLVEQRVTTQVNDTRQAATDDIAKFTTEFMDGRFQDLRTFSQLSTFADPKVRGAMTTAERNAYLRRMVESSPIYDDIAVVDLNGSPIAVRDPSVIQGNVSQLDWFQNVISTQDITWVQPRAPLAGDLAFVLVGAAPIFDTQTGEMISIVRVRLDLEELKQRISDFTAQQAEVGLIDANEEIFLTNTEGTELNPILANLSDRVSWLQDREPQISVLNAGNNPQLTAYAPIINGDEDPQLNWSVVSLVDTSTAYVASRQLLNTVLVGTGITVLLVAAIATLVATRATLPILQITDSVKRLGQGDFGTRINTQGADEIAQLGSNINLMASQIQTLLVKQEESVQQQISAQAQVERAEEERKRNEVLQRELVQLLNEMEEASNGNLTVRTELTAGEIGIIGDVFNAIIENLRSIVIQVKQATGQVNSSIDQSEGAIRELADEALAQMDEITNTLNSVEQMSNSIQEVADNARQAAQVAQVASNAAQDSGTAMDRTVESILDLRSTVAETGKKVKQLGESSQQISQVVSLINEIAMKTNLLAVNASIEAAHAGEEGQGFAVVASEVGQLAEQSAAATKEIEQIVKNIQMGTRDVVEAMERGTTQVVEGTQLVQETKEGLGQIVEVSQKIDELLQSISKATVSQAETSQTVTQLMQQITQASKRTSDSSRAVAGRLQNTVEVARELESAVDQFKVKTDM
ncbi:methyl-accepting chemotaxis protein [Leptolyngbyaceae cyanobacterium CCMR0082]|uniref:Methyl-accepting chemotaxis protein n=1 Tax=Adonisia turfae CCMR0082 TaxID=2304604 RepID=A0A6M0SGA6_9CYAN|nr:methyl-accepting chemotaxis protein [Adonisia turfae]NEZ67620.1 methyl-accepting chemotaxis protein [Adonisia turfae CCMR0082]